MSDRPLRYRVEVYRDGAWLARGTTTYLYKQAAAGIRNAQAWKHDVPADRWRVWDMIGNCEVWRSE